MENVVMYLEQGMLRNAQICQLHQHLRYQSGMRMNILMVDAGGGNGMNLHIPQDMDVDLCHSTTFCNP